MEKSGQPNISYELNAVDELIVIHFLQGLEAVTPDWVEARNNEL
jgi:hypothetical protein